MPRRPPALRKPELTVSQVEWAEERAKRTRTGRLVTGEEIVKDARGNLPPHEWESDKAVEAVDDVTLTRLTGSVHGGADHHGGSDLPMGWVSLRQGDFHRVCSRAYAHLERRQQVKVMGHKPGPRYGKNSLKRLAQAVAAYHVWRHTPRHLRDRVWPKTIEEVALGWEIDASQLREALYESGYERWEGRYLPRTSPEVRASLIRDVLDERIQKQTEVEPGRENANLFRVALATNDALPASAPRKLVLNQNTVNFCTTPEQLKAAEERLKLYAERHFVEVPHVESAVEEEPAQGLPRRSEPEQR